MWRKSRRSFVKESLALAGALAGSVGDPLVARAHRSAERETAAGVPEPARTSVRIRRRIVDTPLGQVHVRVTDGGGLPLLLLHMTPLSGAQFEELMQEMGGERTLIAPDRLGYGASDAPPRELAMEEYAKSTLATLDALGCKKADVLGIHTGSTEAVELASAAPHRFRRVGIIGVPLFNEAELQERRTRRAIPPSPPTEDGAHLLAVWRRRFVLRHPPYDLPYLQWHTVEELKARPYSGLAYKAVYDYPLGMRLTALTQPLIVFAAHDDVMEQTVRSRSMLPANTSYIDLPDFELDIFHVKVKEMADLLRRHFAPEGR